MAPLARHPSQLDNRTRDALPHSSHAKHRLAGVKRSGSSYQWSGIEKWLTNVTPAYASEKHSAWASITPRVVLVA